MKIKSNSNLLMQVEKISREVPKCKLDFSKIQDKEAVNNIAEFLSVSYDQAVLLVCLVELSIHSMVTLPNLARFLRCSALNVVAMMDEFNELERKLLMKKKSRMTKRFVPYNEMWFTVPENVLEALRTNDNSNLKPDLKLRFPSLLQQIRSFVREREEETISTEQLLQEIQPILASNQEHDFMKYINEKLTLPVNKCIAMLIAFFRMTGMVLTDVDYIAELVFDDIADQMEFRRNVFAGNHELVKSGILRKEHSGFANQNYATLSKQALKIIYKDYPELILQELSKEGLIKYQSITQKPLYFNPVLHKQVNEIEDILGKTQFRKFQSISKKNKLSTGITAIFHGSSGTGKTELVLQIAKKTQRDLFMVDLSQTKSMWFGESEKQVKKIFDDYNELLKNSPTAPVLFINEADGLFSKRMEIGSNSSGTSQTLNTIQNIILQELEGFKGILIATTNLQGNLDNAFERRFLFNISFPKPECNVRQMIWKSKMNELTHSMTKTLAERYELSGGQIDNMVRQLLLKRVLDPDMKMFETLLEYCEKENGFTERKRIGF